MSKVIFMPGPSGAYSSRVIGVRDRRYTIRYPFAADVSLIDMETGKQTDGVTSDISLGGCFVCASKPMAVNTRARMTLSRKGQVLESLVIVRIVKPRVGMGIEFFDLESPNNEVLANWIDQLRRNRQQ